MASSWNQCTLMGNLTRPPETKYLPSGTAVCEFSLAINRVFTTQDGEKREEVDFIDCVAFARKAEIIQEYVGKGDPLFVSGRLKQESWTDKATDQKRSKLRVVVDDVQLLGSRKRDDQSQGQSERPASRPAERPAARSTGRPAPPRPPADHDLDVGSEEIPF